MAMQSKPPVSVLHELYEYCKDSGYLIWKTGRFAGKVVSPSVNDKGYRRAWVLGVQYAQHQIIMAMLRGEWVPIGMEVDHINGIRSDNRYCNLREVSAKANRQNNRTSKKRNRLGVLGLSEIKGKFRARIYASGKHIHLGYFDTPQEAQAAYIKAKRTVHSGNTL